jgi:hypothetical protein
MPEIHSEDVVWYCPYGKEGGWGTHYHVCNCSQVDETYVGMQYNKLMGKTLPYHGDRYTPCHCIGEYLLGLEINQQYDNNKNYTKDSVICGSLNDFVLRSNFTVVYGEQGSGKTLAVVALLALSGARNIVSNTRLYKLIYNKFELDKLFDYEGKIIFWDMMEYTATSKFDKYYDNIMGFLNELEENNNHLIIIEQDKNAIEPDIRKLVDMWIMPHYMQTHDAVQLYISRKGENKPIFVNLGNVSQWFKYYNTKDMPVKLNEV